MRVNLMYCHDVARGMKHKKYQEETARRTKRRCNSDGEMPHSRNSAVVVVTKEPATAWRYQQTWGEGRELTLRPPLRTLQP